MREPRLTYDGHEVLLVNTVTTIGRTPDNDVSFPGDPNVSRFHAEIEIRGDEFCLIDLNSSNGTTVNGNKVSGETYLSHGDEIRLGDSASLTFLTEEVQTGAAPEAGAAASETPRDAPTDPSVAATGAAPAVAAAAPDVSGGSNHLLLIAGAMFLVAILFVGLAAGIYLLTRSSSCTATATILQPENGDILIEPTEVQVEVSDAACVAEVIYTIAGIEVASVKQAPFDTTIDPNEFPDLSDGFDHPLGIILVDVEGKRIPQGEPVFLAFETREVEKPPVDITGGADPGGPAPPPTPKADGATLIEVHEMAKALTKQIPNGAAYNISNKQFLQEIQKATAEFAKPGYYNRAAAYRDVINVAYAREQNIEASIGYLLAMSRSQFNNQKAGETEGLWQMSRQFVTDNGYGGLCGDEPLDHPSQNCAAKSSALYMKAMIFGAFDGDVLYSVAAFGKSPQDAIAWKATLPTERSDIWNAITAPDERQKLVRFFAAALVTENPQKFGLKDDRPLSELYRVTL